MTTNLFRRFRACTRGAAAIEFAGIGGMLIYAAMNVADVGRYAYQATEVSQAAQAGAHAALVACDVDQTPATQNCPELQAAVSAALQGTRLGQYVRLNGPIVEGYYCRTLDGRLAKAADATSPPADCSSVANRAGGATPSLYLSLNVIYTWQPMFSDLTVATWFSPYMTRTTWMRMA